MARMNVKVLDATGITDGFVPTADGSGGVAWEAQAGGGGNLSVATKTANYTLTTSDDVILADASGGDFTLTLPTASGNTGKVFYLKRIDQTLANKAVIDPNGTEEIDGTTTKNLSTEHEQYMIVSDGTNWRTISHEISGLWNSYTPTFQGFGTPSSVDFRWQRTGTGLSIVGAFTTGTVTASEARIGLPSGLTITVPASLTMLCGDIARGNASADTDKHFSATMNDTHTYLRMGIWHRAAASNPLATVNGDSVGSSEPIRIVAAGIQIDGWSA